MTSIIAAQSSLTTCSVPWCAAHLPSDDNRVTHLSSEQVVVATSGPERHEVYVSLELADGDEPAVRVQGAGDAPMTTSQALQLAAALTAWATCTAVTTVQAGDDDLIAWARGVVSTPNPLVTERERAIIADLLEQVETSR